MFAATALLTGIAIEKCIYGVWQIPKGRFMSYFIRHLSFLGIISYSFYLIHQPFLLLIRRLPNSLSKLPFLASADGKFIVCLGMYPLLLLLAYLMYQYIEMPSAKLAKPRPAKRA